VTARLHAGYQVTALSSQEPPAEHPGSSNPVVTELAQAYGRPTVVRLLTLLAADLGRLQDDIGGGRGAIEAQAHAVRGAASSLGFTALARACAALEQACACGGPADVTLLAAREECRRARAEIDRFLGVTEAPVG
jgi:HPt (histidine-containing phosphotransfer) domain-containing protein